MAYFTDSIVEEAALSWFAELGFSVCARPEIKGAPEICPLYPFLGLTYLRGTPYSGEESLELAETQELAYLSAIPN